MKDNDLYLLVTHKVSLADSCDFGVMLALHPVRHEENGFNMMV